MASKVEAINQKKLVKQIRDGRNFIQARENDFIYSDGIVSAICQYTDYEVIAKLIKVGAFEDIRNFKASKTFDLEKFFNDESEEFKAEKTAFYLELDDKRLGQLFKINKKCFLYNKDLIEIFNSDLQYKATFHDNYPMLRIYDGDKIVGLIMPLRHDTLGNSINNLIEGEDKCAK